MTSKKDANIASLLGADQSGRLRQLHDQLLSVGLKTKMPSNSATLLFEAVGRDKAKHGLAAFRSGREQLFSFPRPYWFRKTQELNAALSNIDRCHFIETEGFVSSSQYSLMQIRVTEHTMGALQEIIGTLIATHVRQLGEPS